MAIGDPDEGRAQRRVVALSVAEVGQEQGATRRGSPPPRPLIVRAFSARRPQLIEAPQTQTSAPPSERPAGYVHSELGAITVRHDVAVVGDAEVRAGPLTTEFRHDDAPAISLIGPGASTSLPKAAHWLSAAADDDRDSRRQARAGGGVRGTSPAWAHGADTAGNSAGSSAEGVEQIVRPGSGAEVEEDRGVGVRLVGGRVPVSACSTTSRGCMKQSAPQTLGLVVT